MDALHGIDSSCLPPLEGESSSTICRRDSSISLEDKATGSKARLSLVTTHRRTGSNPLSTPYDPEKSPLLLFQPQELHTPSKPRSVTPEDNGCPLLPEEPSPPSTPLFTMPLEVYLDTEEKHEVLLMKNVSAENHHRETLQKDSLTPDGKLDSAIASEISSWEVVDKPSSVAQSHKENGLKASLKPIVVDDEVVTLHLGGSESAGDVSSSSNISVIAGIGSSQSLNSNVSNPSLALMDIVPAKRYHVPEDQNEGVDVEEMKSKFHKASDTSKSARRLNRMARQRKRKPVGTGGV